MAFKKIFKKGFGKSAITHGTAALVGAGLGYGLDKLETAKFMNGSVGIGKTGELNEKGKEIKKYTVQQMAVLGLTLVGVTVADSMMDNDYLRAGTLGASAIIGDRTRKKIASAISKDTPPATEGQSETPAEEKIISGRKSPGVKGLAAMIDNYEDALGEIQMQTGNEKVVLN